MTDLEGVDIHQAYVDFSSVFGLPWSFRVGRQELIYGDQRFLSALDWHPVGRAFDGVKTWYEGDDWQVNLFVTTIDENSLTLEGTQDDDQIFAGFYFQYRGIHDHEVDAYVFYRGFVDGSFLAENGDAGDLEDFTIGLRASGRFGGFFYHAEGAYQFGDRASDEISAHAWALKVGHAFEASWKPKLSFEWTFASGDDDPTDGKAGTFDPLYGFAHYYQGFLDLFAWRNGHDLALRFEFVPASAVTIEVATHYFLLDSDRDAWFAASGLPIRRSPAGGVSNEIGWELDLSAKIAVNEATKIWFGWSHFFPGDYVSDTGSSPEMDFFYFQVTVNF